MPRYIDADRLINGIRQAVCTTCAIDYDKEKCRCDTGDCICYIEDCPTADVEPVRHGRWIRGKNKSAFPAKPPAIWYCSCCGEMIRYNDSTGTYQKKKKKVNEVNPRCRRCGAKMDGDNNGKDNSC